MTRPQRSVSRVRSWTASSGSRWNMPKRTALNELAWLSIRWRPNLLSTSSSSTTTFTFTSMTLWKHRRCDTLVGWGEGEELHVPCAPQTLPKVIFETFLVTSLGNGLMDISVEPWITTCQVSLIIERIAELYIPRHTRSLTLRGLPQECPIPVGASAYYEDALFSL